MDNSKIIDKIKKVLALGDSPNLGEAENAMKLAYELMAKYNLSIKDIDHQESSYTTNEKLIGSRNTIKNRCISELIKDHFQVEIVFSTRNRSVNRKFYTLFVGTKTNVEIAEYMYCFFSNLFESEWKKHKVSSEIQKNQKSFYIGLMIGIGQQLTNRRKHFEQENAIVIVKDPNIIEFYRKQNPDLEVGRAHKLGKLDSDDLQAGLDIGKNVHLADALCEE